MLYLPHATKKFLKAALDTILKEPFGKLATGKSKCQNSMKTIGAATSATARSSFPAACIEWLRLNQINNCHIRLV